MQKCNLLVLQLFSDYIMLMWEKDTRLSPLFRTASNRKLGGARERGYKSSTMQNESIIVSILCYSLCYVPHSEFVWLLHSLFPQSFHQLGTEEWMSLPAHVSIQHWHPSVGMNASHFFVLPLDLLCLCACVEKYQRLHCYPRSQALNRTASGKLGEGLGMKLLNCYTKFPSIIYQ